MHIGQTLKAVMKQRNVSTSEMALHCEVTRGAVSNWFSTGRITKENLVKAAAKLGVTVEELVMGGLGERTTPALPPLPVADAADETFTLLSHFKQLDGAKRALVIKFAEDQVFGRTANTEIVANPKLKPAPRLVPRAIKDEGAISKRPKTSELSGARGRKGRK